MFEGITGAVRSTAQKIRTALDDSTIKLDIETKAGGISFDAVNAGWYARNGYPGIYSILSGGMPAWSGEPVSVETALNHSVVWACNRIISESVGFLPLIMMRETTKGKVLATDHPMYIGLKDCPNIEMTSMGFRETRTSQCLLHGNAYAQILRRSGTGTAIELHPLDQAQVRTDREKAGQKRLVYIVKDSSAPEKTYTVDRQKPQDILHIRGLGFDGVRGFSVITMARQSIGTAISAERHVARFYANGGRVPYILKMQKRFNNDGDFDKFRSDWEKTYSEPHKVPILENGTEYQAIGLNAVDSQMLQTRLFDIHEICRWFLVSPHLVGDLSRATFSNIEQLALEFVKMTLSTWLTRWEQELWRCVLTNDEKSSGYFFRHNLDALLRGDFQSRVQGYATLLQNGVAAINEVRDLENWNPIEGGDFHHIQLNMQAIPGSQSPDTQRTAATQSSALVRVGD
jgi:HK97 family phage portal protein